MTPIPIVIDTDPGVDDFFCIALGCIDQDLLNLKAICTMGGNHYTDVTTQNALDILSLFGRDDVPVARGADRYLTEEFGEPVVEHHGTNGLGDVNIPHSDRKPDPLPACDKLYEIARSAKGELVLVTVDPVTNIGMALQKHPDLPQYLKKIVMMGGSLTHGNITPYAEANIGHDAEAAAIVFESGIPIDMVGLNVTSVCPIDTDIIKNYDGKVKPEILSAMLDLIRFRHGEPMHDIIALSTLIDEDLMTWQRGRITVETADPERKGQTIFTQDDQGSVRAAVTVNVQRYNAIIDGMLARLADKNS